MRNPSQICIKINYKSHISVPNPSPSKYVYNFLILHPPAYCYIDQSVFLIWISPR